MCWQYESWKYHRCIWHMKKTNRSYIVYGFIFIIFWEEESSRCQEKWRRKGWSQRDMGIRVGVGWGNAVMKLSHVLMILVVILVCICQNLQNLIKIVFYRHFNGKKLCKFDLKSPQNKFQTLMAAKKQLHSKTHVINAGWGQGLGNKPAVRMKMGRGYAFSLTKKGQASAEWLEYSHCSNMKAHIPQSLFGECYFLETAWQKKWKRQLDVFF